MRYIFVLFITWRVVLFFISWVGSQLLTFAPRFPYSDVFLIPSGLPEWFWSFANFDGVHYLTIAKAGYSAQFTQVFFPLYSLLIRLVHFLFPGLNTVFIGIVISSLFLLLALCVFWELISLDYKKNQILWIILFLVFSPSSFFFGSLYTESLFLFLVLSSFYMARRQKWWLAGIFGGIASVTRLVGIFLLPALLLEWWNQNKLKTANQNLKITKFYQLTRHYTLDALHSPILYLVPLGLISYMLYLQLKFDDALYFWHVQPVFGAGRSGAGIILLPQVIWRYIKIIMTVSPYSEAYWISILELFSTIGAIMLLIIAHFQKVRLSYLVFSWLAVIIPTLTGTLSSMPRYILVAFPIYIVLGLVKNRALKTLLFTICYLLFTILTILFTRGHWVS